MMATGGRPGGGVSVPDRRTGSPAAEWGSEDGSAGFTQRDASHLRLQ
jgi:hypothetical protein